MAIPRDSGWEGREGDGLSDIRVDVTGSNERLRLTFQLSLNIECVETGDDKKALLT